ncbi:VQ motif-containing protein, partial [Zea mays]
MGAESRRRGFLLAYNSARYVGQKLLLSRHRAPNKLEPLSPAASAASPSAAPKPPRKRPRVSRRPPPTVITTDVSNFRAMVQEFTGIPTPLPFAPHHLAALPAARSSVALPTIPPRQ